jgi:hypothetical protein
MEFEGILQGNRLTITTTKLIQGAARQFTLEGYVVGDRLVATLSGIATNKKPASGFVTATKK